MGFTLFNPPIEHVLVERRFATFAPVSFTDYPKSWNMAGLTTGQFSILRSLPAVGLGLWLLSPTPPGCAQPPPLAQTFNPQGEQTEAFEAEHFSLASTASAQPTVTQLTDVAPTDWAFQALQNLVERYDCLVDYGDGTFRGDRRLTRFEFAAALNACVTAVIAQTAGEPMTENDLQVLQGLQQAFADELGLFDSRLTALEGQTAALSTQSFSTTTQLRGEIVLSVEQLGGGDQPNGSGDRLPQALTFGSRARFNLDTSFTGQDLLRLRLDVLNPAVLNAKATGTQMTRLAFDRSNQNEVDIGSFFYRFPLGEALSVQVDAAQGTYSMNVLPTFNPGIASGISGAVSRFGRFSPIYYQGFPGVGITGQYDFGERVSLAVGYLSRENTASDPTVGIFGGGYTALAQLAIYPSKTTALGLTYAHSYYPPGAVAVAGGTGSRLANAPFGNLATSADHLGLESSLRLGSGVNLSGWAGLSFATAEASSGAIAAGDAATLFNWALTLGLPNLGGRGNLGGLIVGQPPKVTANSGGAIDGASAWHLETFYRYQLNEHIALIPGFFVVLNPEHDSANEAIWLASFRTVFQF
ncbi:iron uptake porin [Almyronema epifaneia]|uniref:Iron uptake porin n=1 Tax=Almyronema epifaneia S1 TaxID=2991925 RepID=A0ABW6IFF8_9CYAN